MAKNRKKLTYDQAIGVLKYSGLSKEMIERVEEPIRDRALEFCDSIQFDRIYTLITFVLSDFFDMSDEDVFKGLMAVDETVGKIRANDISWPELMERVYDKTGILIQSGDEKRTLFEFKPEEL